MFVRFSLHECFFKSPFSVKWLSSLQNLQMKRASANHSRHRDSRLHCVPTRTRTCGWEWDANVSLLQRFPNRIYDGPHEFAGASLPLIHRHDHGVDTAVLARYFVGRLFRFLAIHHFLCAPSPLLCIADKFCGLTRGLMDTNIRSGVAGLNIWWDILPMKSNKKNLHARMVKKNRSFGNRFV